MFTYLFLSALGRYILKRHIILIMIPEDFVTLLISMFRENNDSQLSDSDTCTNFSIRHNYYCPWNRIKLQFLYRHTAHHHTYVALVLIKTPPCSVTLKCDVCEWKQYFSWRKINISYNMRTQIILILNETSQDFSMLFADSLYVFRSTSMSRHI